MKNIFYVILMMFGTISNAQTVSLESMAQYRPGTFPNADYVKDTNGLLNKYIGTWKGTLGGKNYELSIIKKENVGESNQTKWDRLIGKIKITNSNGAVEFNNFNIPDEENSFIGYNFQKDLKAYIMSFSGEKTGCIDDGYVYLRMKSDNPNQLKINFHPQNDIVTQNCNGFETTLPNNKIITLTKQ